jgi:endonuclease YncB( thermonuclease family)
MANGKALWVKNTIKMGEANFGFHGSDTGSVREIVHDGDTVNVRLSENLGVRFLGMDSPEVSFEFPGTGGFLKLSNPKWDTFFRSGDWRAGVQAHPGLLNHLEQRIGNGEGVAANHARLADAAQKSLENSMIDDLQGSGKTKEEFRFFMAFAHEFLDVYGRLLCYLHCDKGNYADPEQAPETSYNERQLASGAASPYFIWPNVQPFLRVRPFSEENVRPAAFWALIAKGSKLRKAREAVAAARTAGLGVYNPADPLRVRPFELRFLARKKAPDRFVIDLTQPGSNKLLAPDLYYTVPNDEDRLHIPGEYLPIFQMYGWELLTGTTLEAS